MAVLAGDAALLSRVDLRFRMRSRLVNSVGLFVVVSVGVASLCTLGTDGCCTRMDRVIRLLSMSLLLVGPVVGLLVVGPLFASACTLGTRCVLGV